MQSRQGVTLIGAGDPRREDLEEALKMAPVLVAADGGADHAAEWGHIPEHVIGDLDSVSAGLRSRLPADRVHPVDDQDTTDFQKCLALIDAPFIVATGFTSGRIDHTLAVCGALAQRTGPPTLVLGASDVVFAAPARLALDLPPGTRVSLFPMGPLTGRSTGLRWRIDGLDLAPAGRLGTSNEATGPVTVESDAPGLLVILPRSARHAALAALTA